MSHAGGSFGSEWVQRWSEDRMWEIRAGEEGHHLWRKSSFTSVHNYYDNLICVYTSQCSIFVVVCHFLHSTFFHWKQRHPDGVASVAFKEPEEADTCQVALDGRWFGGRKLSAQLWDGVTDYQVKYCLKPFWIVICTWVYFLDLMFFWMKRDIWREWNLGRDISLSIRNLLNHEKWVIHTYWMWVC